MKKTLLTGTIAALVSAGTLAAPPSPSLEVAVVGGGVVTSDPTAIDCREGSGVCSSEFTKNSSVTLTAKSDSNNEFVTWQGACEGAAPSCSINMKGGAKTVTAVFESVEISYPAPVQATGQVSCRDTAGFVIPCEGTGQDGETRVGVQPPTPRFTDLGDGSVLDNTTGLIWLKNPSCMSSNYPELLDETYDGVSWQMALDFVAGINNSTYYCGTTATGWRLPNVRELQSLVDYESYDSFPPPFDDVMYTGWGLWSSTSRPVNSDQAYYVSVSDGSTKPNLKTWPYASVTAVRSGQ